MRYIIHEINYDEGHDDLPQEISLDLPDTVVGEELEQTLSDHISNVTGFCHKGFLYRVERNKSYLVMIEINDTYIVRVLVRDCESVDAAQRSALESQIHADPTWVEPTVVQDLGGDYDLTIHSIQEVPEADAEIIARYL